MEDLLDAADALVADYPDGDPPRPNFDFPVDYDTNSPHRLMEIRVSRREGTDRGKGWFAKKDIPAGTTLIIDKPLAMVMNWQDDVGDEGNEEEDIEMSEDEEKEEEQFSSLNEMLLLELLQEIRQNHSIWADNLSHMYPRDNQTASTLPMWVCQDDEIFALVEASFEELTKVPELDEQTLKDIKYRLPLIIRYNCLSVETCPELLVHPGPGGHASLGGTAVYYLPSFFNHDSHPNASRYAVGDVMWFVANRDIKKGDEICISYLEHDVLCENAKTRTTMLQMDFADGKADNIKMSSTSMADVPEGGEEDTEAPDFPVVDDLVQSELMSMEPMERLEAIQQLYDQAIGESGPDGDVEEMGVNMEEDMKDTAWFQCDVQNLRILRAITLDGQGKSDQAMEEWEECVKFAETKLPPLDENGIAMRVQAALCARCAGKMDLAKKNAEAALISHNILFGGGVERFRRRYHREVQLTLRRDTGSFEAGGFAALDELWPVQMG